VTTALYDAPGPKARRRILVGSLISAVLVALVIVAIVQRLSDAGQFRSIFWEPFTTAPVQRILWRGLLATLRASAVALVLAILLGLILAAGRLSEHRWLGQASGVVVEFFRALPLVLLIFFAFLGLPRLGFEVTAFGALVIGLTLYNGSVLAEIFRAGINAVPPGQAEAAYSIGLRKGAVTRLILVPQAVRIMLPAIVSQMVVLLKDSALGFIVAYPELLRSGRRIYTNIGNIIPTAIVIAAIYITINLMLTAVATYLERRQRRGGRGRDVAVPVEIGVDLP
jgi:glutamate transport system permease protein